MLLDVYDEVGLDGMAQVDLDIRHNSHQSLLALSAMAHEILGVIAARLERDARLTGLDPLPLPGGGPARRSVERPPMLGARGAGARARPATSISTGPCSGAVPRFYTTVTAGSRCRGRGPSRLAYEQTSRWS